MKVARSTAVNATLMLVMLGSEGASNTAAPNLTEPTKEIAESFKQRARQLTPNHSGHINETD